MFSKFIQVALFLIVATCLSLAYAKISAQGRETVRANTQFLVAATVYSQPPSPSGGLLQSSWWDPNGSDYDQYVWDNVTLQSTRVITEVQWRGGYDPSKFGSGGPVIDFTVAMYASIPAGTQPDLANPPLVEYHTGGNAGQISAGIFGGIPMYDYFYTLPMPFEAAAGTRYWLQIEAVQHGIPDWGITVGSGGDGKYFRRIASIGDVYYQIVPGDAAFTLLGPPIGGYRICVPLVYR